MSRHLPLLLFLTLLAAAAMIVGAGMLAARRVTEEVTPRDRTPLRVLAGGFQGEIARLEALYEKHLRRLALEMPQDDAFVVKDAASAVAGVRQISFVAAPSQRGRDVHVAIGGDDPELPEPTFQSQPASPLRRALRLPAELAHEPAGASGWGTEAGQPPWFWMRRSQERFAIILVDPAAVAGAMTGALHEWSASAFRPVRAAGGPDRVVAAGGRTLAEAGSPPAASPDFLLPLHSRFGQWEIQSWRLTRSVTGWHTPTLAGAAALASLVALSGGIAAWWQRKALRLAAQRVSFVNRVSHELRAPLTNILLNADLAAESTSGEGARRLEVVQNEAARLGRLIDNVLAFARSGASARPQALRPLGDVLEEARRVFQPAFASRKITLRLSGLEAVGGTLVEAEGTAQIVANLFSNAEKYAPGGTLHVSAHTADGWLRLLFADDGPGIPPRERARIFAPFHRVHNSLTEGVSGTGLGLCIARDLAQRAGGSLELRPSEKGAVFELRLPAQPAGGSAAAQPGNAPPVVETEPPRSQRAFSSAASAQSGALPHLTHPASF